MKNKCSGVTCCFDRHGFSVLTRRISFYQLSTQEETMEHE